MNHKKSELYFLLAFLAGISVLIFFIFKPFLYALIMAIIFATVFEPLHKKILTMTQGRSVLSAFLATISVLAIVVAPLLFLSVQIFQETKGLYFYLTLYDGENNIFSQVFNGASFFHSVENALQSLARFSPAPIDSPDISQYLKEGLNWLLQHFGLFFTNVAKIMMGIFIFLVALFYLFKDGYKLKKAVVALSPLQEIYIEAIFSKLALSINSIIKGSLAVAFIQGVLTAVGFTIFGIQNATLWGSVAAITALIPGIGTALVIIPGVLFLFFSGETFLAIGLLLWGIVAVGLVDNFLGPKFVERGTNLHPFLILTKNI